MTQLFVGVGGIGCQLLTQFQAHTDPQPHRYFLYLDREPYSLPPHDPENNTLSLCLSLPQAQGIPTSRLLCREQFHVLLYSGALAPLNRSLPQGGPATLTLVTSSFGGLGSSIALELSDYLSVQLCPHAPQMVEARLLLFSHQKFLEERWFLQNLSELFALNTADTANELLSRRDSEAKLPAGAQRFRLFPQISAYLVEGGSNDWPLLHWDPAVLSARNTLDGYRLAPHKPKSPEVFISYTTPDLAVAQALTEELKRQDITYWFAPEAISSGSYPTQILQGIRQAKVFIVIVSPAALRSPNVMSEVNRAFHRMSEGLRMIPFLISGSRPEDDSELTYYLCGQEWFDGKVPPIANRLAELAQEVKNYLTKE